KVLWENGLECYHCTLNHPEFSAVVDVDDYGDQLNRRELAEYDYIPERPLLPGAERRRGAKPIRRDGELGFGSTVLQWHLGLFEAFFGPDGVFVGSFRPLSQTSTAVRIMGLCHEDSVPGTDFDPDEVFELARITRRQDDRLCESIQRGIVSHAYQPGPYNEELEAGNQAFARA